MKQSSLRAVGFAAGFGVLLFVLLLVGGITTGILPWRDSYASAPDPTPPAVTDSQTNVTTTAAPSVTPTPVPSPTPTPTVLDEEIKTYTVTVTFSKGGTAVPYGMTSVVQHGNLEIVAVPDAGYGVEDMIVNGVHLGSVTRFLIEDATENYSVYISFSRQMFAPTPAPNDGGDDTTDSGDEDMPDENGNYG